MGLFNRIKDPVEGTAYVSGCSAIDPENMRAPCRMQLVVQAPGIPAFSCEQVFEVWAGQWPEPGQTLPVTIDRTKHERIKIDWDRVPSWQDEARQNADQLAAQLRGEAPPAGTPQTLGGLISPGIPVQVIGADPSSPEAKAAIAKAERALGVDLDGDGLIGGGDAQSPAAAPPTGAGRDTVSQLERLAKLRDQGALTPHEFELEKKKILSE